MSFQNIRSSNNRPDDGKLELERYELTRADHYTNTTQGAVCI